MWVKVNPNPYKKHVPDCVIRAICVALDMDWYSVYDGLCEVGRMDCNVPSADAVWGHYLKLLGFIPFTLPLHCPACTTIREFCKMYPNGIYIIGTGSHAVAIKYGNYYDNWDSGEEVPSFFWKIQ